MYEYSHFDLVIPDYFNQNLEQICHFTQNFAIYSEHIELI